MNRLLQRGLTGCVGRQPRARFDTGVQSISTRQLLFPQMPSPTYRRDHAPLATHSESSPGRDTTAAC